MSGASISGAVISAADGFTEALNLAEAGYSARSVDPSGKDSGLAAIHIITSHKEMP